MKRVALALAVSLLACGARAACPTLPYTLTNGQTADATQVMSDFTYLQSCLFSSAHSGANTDITSLGGLTTPLTASQGGTGNTTGQPAGAAGGDLAGTYPNPTLAPIITAGNLSYPSNLSVDAKGRIIGGTSGGVFTGDTGSGGTVGIVPAPPSGSAAAGAFLGANGSWSVPPYPTNLSTGSVGTKGTGYFKLGPYYFEYGSLTAPAGFSSVTLPVTPPTAVLFSSANADDNSTTATYRVSAVPQTLSVLGIINTGTTAVSVNWFVVAN